MLFLHPRQENPLLHGVNSGAGFTKWSALFEITFRGANVLFDWFLMVIFSKRLLPLSHSPCEGVSRQEVWVSGQCPPHSVSRWTVLLTVGRWTRKYVAHIGCHGNGLL